MARRKDDLIERERGHLRGLVAALQERLKPQVALLLHVVGAKRGAKHDIRQQVEGLRERALGDVELHGERLRTGAGIELRAEVGEFALKRVRVAGARDRKSTRLNSSHRCISYAVFCL